jgi:hypothetical protein
MNYLQYWPVAVVLLGVVAYVFWPKSTPAATPAPQPQKPCPVPTPKDTFEQEVAKLPKEVKPEVKPDSSVVVLDKPEVMDVKVDLPVDKTQVASTLSHEADLHKKAAIQKQVEVDNHKMVADHLTKAVKELN